MYSSRELNLISSRQAPLLPLAVAMLLGFCAAKKFDFLIEYKTYFEIAAITLATISIQVFSSQKIYPKLYKFLFFAFLFTSCVSYFSEMHFQNPYPDFASRETKLKLEILSTSTNSKSTSYGVAKVKDAPEYFSDAINMKLWFYLKDCPDLFKGQTVISDFIVRANPNESDFDKYLASQNIDFTASNFGDVKIEQATFPYSFYKKCKNFLYEKLSVFPKSYDKNSAGALAYKAMILGEKSLLSKDAQNDFSKTGTMHIFAVSGLHVGMLAAVIFLLLTILRVGKSIQPIVCLPILFLYVNICQAKPSAMRAFLMICFIWISIAFLRKPKPFAGLVAAFVFTLFLNPYALFDAGFELSYMIVCAMLLYAIELDDFLNESIEKFRGFTLKHLPLFTRIVFSIERYFLIAFCISFAALIASAPLSAAYFGYVAPIGILFSLIYVGLATLVVAIATLAIFLPDFILQYTNLIAAKIMALMIEGANIGANLNLSLDFSISKISLFVLTCLNIFSLLFFLKVNGLKKWFVFPLTGTIGLLCAYILESF